MIVEVKFFFVGHSRSPAFLVPEKKIVIYASLRQDMCGERIRVCGVYVCEYTCDVRTHILGRCRCMPVFSPREKRSGDVNGRKRE